MSYNISRWNTKVLDNFIIAVEAFQAIDDEIELTRTKDKTYHLSGFAEGFAISGTMPDDEHLKVEQIDLWGVASGWMWEGFKKALAQSSGRLVATQVWEGGDHISGLEVDNGVVREDRIEI